MTNRRVFYDPKTIHDIALLFAAMVVLNFFIFKESLVYFLIFFYIFWRSILYQDIGTKVDEYYFVKHRSIMNILNHSLLTGFAVTWLVKSYLYQSTNPKLFMSVVGIVFLIVGILMFLNKDAFKIRKSPKDFPNLKQETMYDLGLDGREIFKNKRILRKHSVRKFIKKSFFGLIKKEKEVLEFNGDGSPKYKEKLEYISTSNLRMVDDDGNILLERKKEIDDIINGINLDYYNYSLTTFDNEAEAEKFMKILELDETKMVKKRHRLKGVKYEDGYTFARWWYKELQKCIKQVSTEDEPLEYDFRAALARFDGVFEYAFIDMYRFVTSKHDGFKNRPIGDTYLLAEKDSQLTGIDNMKQLCGAMGSTLGITAINVVPTGAAYYTGYYLKLVNENVNSSLEVKKNNEWIPFDELEKYEKEAILDLIEEEKVKLVQGETFEFNNGLVFRRKEAQQY